MFSVLYIISKATRKKSIAKSNQQGLETSYKMTKGPRLHHAQQSLIDLMQSSTKVNTNMQIRVHIFARASHRSNLFITTNTTNMSHRSRVEVGMQDLVHVHLLYDRIGGWLKTLDQIGDVIIRRTRWKTLLHHLDIH